MMPRKKLIVIMIVFSTCYARLNHPADGQELNYIHILFEWDQEPSAISYNLQLSYQQFFDDIFLDIEEPTTVYIDKNNFTWESNYYWRVRPVYENNIYGSWLDTLTFSTAESKFDITTEIIDEDEIQNGLIIIGKVFPLNISKSSVFDKFGNEIWNNGELNFGFTFLAEHGQIMGAVFSEGSFGTSLSSEGEILFETPVSVDPHEIIQLPNGNYMWMISVYELGPIPIGDWTDEFQVLGYVADGITEEKYWKGQKLIEYNIKSEEVVWSWDPFEYYTMNDYDQYGNDWYSALHSWFYDWLHTNSFYFDENESVIYVSNRHLSRITKIDYPSGNIIWMMGLPAEHMYSGDEHICTELLFSYQHNIQLLDNGHLLMFDNGNLSDTLNGTEERTSRVLEIQVIDDSYCEIIWEYQLENYTDSQGSVQLLKNGNYLISHFFGDPPDHHSIISEVTSEKEIIFQAIIDPQINNKRIYRAYKIPSIHPNAFSVLLDQYRNVDIDGTPFTGVVLDNMNSSLSFTIYNHSGYNQPYVYSLSDDNEWFPTVSDTVFIDAGEQSSFSFYPDISRRDLFTSLRLVVTPVHHDWYAKHLYHEIFAMPQVFKIDQNYPNPFNPVTTLRYDLPEDALVHITIYDMMGRVVKTLINDQQTAGYRSTQWNATNNAGSSVSAGLYLYMIQAGDFRQTKKMVLLK